MQDRVHKATFVPIAQYEALFRKYQQVSEIAAELATELSWIEGWIANSHPTVTDTVKVAGIAYYQEYCVTPSRPDGRRYYSRERIAGRMGNVRKNPKKDGNKEQSLSPIHTKLKLAGLVDSVVERQQSNERHKNYFDIMTPQWLQNPSGVVLDSDANKAAHGGARVPRHRGCGGAIEMYGVCQKCHETRIAESQIMLVSESGDVDKSGWDEEKMAAISALEEMWAEEDGAYAERVDQEEQDIDAAMEEHEAEEQQQQDVAPAPIPIESMRRRPEKMSAPLRCPGCGGYEFVENTLRNKWQCVAGSCKLVSGYAVSPLHQLWGGA